MFEDGIDHIRIVNDGLSNDGRVDEKTLWSISILSQRLKKLKESNPIFAEITLSNDVNSLASKQMASAVIA